MQETPALDPGAAAWNPASVNRLGVLLVSLSVEEGQDGQDPAMNVVGGRQHGREGACGLPLRH